MVHDLSTQGRIAASVLPLLFLLMACGGGSSTPAPTPILAPTPAPAPTPSPTSDTPDFGPNVQVFDPSTPAATVQAALDAAFNAELLSATAQFGGERHAFLFKPGTYAVTANLVFYESIAIARRQRHHQPHRQQHRRGRAGYRHLAGRPGRLSLNDNRGP